MGPGEILGLALRLTEWITATGGYTSVEFVSLNILEICPRPDDREIPSISSPDQRRRFAMLHLSHDLQPYILIVQV